MKHQVHEFIWRHTFLFWHLNIGFPSKHSIPMRRSLFLWLDISSYSSCLHWHKGWPWWFIALCDMWTSKTSCFSFKDTYLTTNRLHLSHDKNCNDSPQFLNCITCQCTRTGSATKETSLKTSDSKNHTINVCSWGSLKIYVPHRLMLQWNPHSCSFFSSQNEVDKPHFVQLAVRNIKWQQLHHHKIEDGFITMHAGTLFRLLLTYTYI